MIEEIRMNLSLLGVIQHQLSVSMSGDGEEQGLELLGSINGETQGQLDEWPDAGDGQEEGLLEKLECVSDMQTLDWLTSASDLEDDLHQSSKASVLQVLQDKHYQACGIDYIFF